MWSVRLFVVEGPDASREAVVPNFPFVVGRHREASLVLNDPTVSRRHFQLVVDSGRLMVEDLASSSGLEVNGQPISRGQLHDLDIIRAGTTYLRVLVQERSSPSQGIVSQSSRTEVSSGASGGLRTDRQSLGRLQEAVAEQVEHAFAIVDACGEWSVPSKMDELGDRASCLYSGASATRLRGIAPYLVALDRSVLDWLIKTLWDRPWGVVVFASVGVDELRRHLRQFLQVKVPDDNTLMLRYYDPRVLPMFLTSLNDAERNTFFGPIQSFWTTENESVLKVYSLASALVNTL